jgi:LysM repeat protein
MRLYRLVLVLVLGTIALAQFASVSAEGNSAPTEQKCTPVQPSGWVEYRIASGDTLSDIAADTDSTVDELARVNCIGNSRHIVADQHLFVPRLPDPALHHFLRRCLNAGYTTQQCRRIYNALHDSDIAHFAERCLNAGYTTQQCRRIYNALFGDDNALAERCRAADLTPEECRRLVNADPDRAIAERCRAAGLTPEQCRRIVDSNSEVTVDVPQPDQVRPVDERGEDENTERSTRP